MQKVIKSEGKDEGSTVIVETGRHDTCVNIWQKDDLMVLFDERQARKVVKAIRKVAKELGWKV